MSLLKTVLWDAHNGCGVWAVRLAWADLVLCRREGKRKNSRVYQLSPPRSPNTCTPHPTTRQCTHCAGVDEMPVRSSEKRGRAAMVSDLLRPGECQQLGYLEYWFNLLRPTLRMKGVKFPWVSNFRPTTPSNLQLYVLHWKPYTGCWHFDSAGLVHAKNDVAPPGRAYNRYMFSCCCCAREADSLSKAFWCTFD